MDLAVLELVLRWILFQMEKKLENCEIKIDFLCILEKPPNFSPTCMQIHFHVDKFEKSFRLSLAKSLIVILLLLVEILLKACRF